MSNFMFYRDWTFVLLQTLFVRFALERKWDSILSFFGNDDKMTVIAGNMHTDIYFLNINVFQPGIILSL